MIHTGPYPRETYPWATTMGCNGSHSPLSIASRRLVTKSRLSVRVVPYLQCNHEWEHQGKGDVAKLYSARATHVSTRTPGAE
jgi:hypothetical protein